MQSSVNPIMSTNFTQPMEGLHKNVDNSALHSSNQEIVDHLQKENQSLTNDVEKHSNNRNDHSGTHRDKILGEVEMTEAFRKSQTDKMSENEDSRYCIIELPVHVKAGDSLQFVWPSNNDGHEKSFGFIVPACFPTPGIVRRDPITGEEKAVKRTLRIVAPDAPEPEITKSMRTHFQMAERRRKRHLAQASSSRNVSRRAPSTSTKSSRMSSTESAMNIRWKVYKKSSSRIGQKFQAENIPIEGSWKEEFGEDMKNKHDTETIWNPQKAKCAIYRGQDVTKFLESLPTNRKFLGLEALHCKDYNVTAASDILEKHIKLVGPEVQGDKLGPQKSRNFRISMKTNQKNFNKISKDLSISVATTLVHYYAYFKPSPFYQRMRLNFKKELNECQKCGQGGVLICCDSCASPYHLACVNLLSVPDDEWFCPKCVRKLN